MLRILFPIILLMFPLSVIAEWVCPAPAGCKIVQDTGECIGCIEVEEPPIIKEEKVMVEKKPVVKVSDPPLYPRVNVSLRNKVKTKKKKGVCYVKPCDWLDTPSRVSQSKDRKPRKRERNWVGTLFECIVGCKEGVKYWDGRLVFQNIEGMQYDY